MRTVLCLTERAAWRPFVARRGGEGREEIAGTEGEAAWRRLARRAKAGPSSCDDRISLSNPALSGSLPIAGFHLRTLTRARARAIAVATGKWAA